MKKMMFAAILIMAMISAPANAQVKFGLKAGANVTNMSLSSDVLKAENRTGFFVGPTIKVQLPVVGLGVDLSALYDQRESKISGQGVQDVTLKQKSMQVPVNLRYGIGFSSVTSIFFYAGPQFGFNIGDKELSDYTLQSSNISVNVGAGIMALSHLQLSANYNIACGKTADFKATNILKSDAKSNAWQIALTYYF